jgi:hypothetical protein
MQLSVESNSLPVAGLYENVFVIVGFFAVVVLLIIDWY